MQKSRTVTSLLICYILFNLALIFYQNKEKYLTFNYWQTFAEQRRVFYDSQYKNKHYRGFIPDEAAYSYAGGALIRGENPVLTIPEAPPLGKYLIGLSAVLFNNPNIIIIVLCGPAGLFMLYLLARQVFGSTALALMPVAATVSEPLYRNQYKYVPLFDIAQLFFLVSALYFFNRGLRSAKRALLFFILATLFVGFFVSTKFYTSGLTILLPFVLVLLLNKDKGRLVKLAMTLWIPVAVLLTT